MRSSPPEGLGGSAIPRFESPYTGEPSSFAMGENPRGMRSSQYSRALPALMAAAVLALLAGCGSDSSGETSTTAATAAPAVTSPIPTSSTLSTTATSGKKKSPGTTTTAGGSGGCSIPDAYTNFKFTGLDCTAALAVATAWDQNGKTCNTVDNPESPIGPQRTCSVNGYSCTAKRDIHSDARFVTCTQGGQTVRFTWLPA
jgi:hypothetical protein